MVLNTVRIFEKSGNILGSVIEEEPVLLTEEPVQIFVSEFRDSCIDMGIRYSGKDR